jgi:hypothetical protein
MIVVLRNCGKDIRSRRVECLGGELHSGVCAVGESFFLIMLVFAVDTDGTCAADSGGMMCAHVILGSAPGMLCHVRRWCVLGFVWRIHFEVRLFASSMIGVLLTF